MILDTDVGKESHGLMKEDKMVEDTFIAALEDRSIRRIGSDLPGRPARLPCLGGQDCRRETDL